MSYKRKVITISNDAGERDAQVVQWGDSEGIIIEQVGSEDMVWVRATSIPALIAALTECMERKQPRQQRGVGK